MHRGDVPLTFVHVGATGVLDVGATMRRRDRVRVRPPCFAIMSALPKLLVGDMIADLTPTFGSVNMIGGELDR